MYHIFLVLLRFDIFGDQFTIGTSEEPKGCYIGPLPIIALTSTKTNDFDDGEALQNGFESSLFNSN